MGGNKVELKKQIDLSLKVLQVRKDRYQAEVIALRKTVLAYFLDESNNALLTEAASGEEVVFEWKKMREMMQACLVDESQLLSTAALLQSQQGITEPNIVAALDHHVLNSGLALIDSKTGYSFEPAKPYTPNAQAFMQQFACALNAYRIYLRIYQAYFKLFSYEFLNTQPHQSCIDKASSLSLAIKETAEIDLNESFLEAKKIKKEIKTLLESIREGMEVFQKEVLAQAPELTQLFHSAAINLETYYKQHPNKSHFWFAVDSPWQILLKELAASLFDNQYTYSSVYGTLTILPNFIETINKEIVEFFTTALEKILDYRIALLGEALEIVDEVLRQLRLNAATRGISLRLAETTTLAPTFFSPGKDAIYSLMRKYIQQDPNAQEDSDIHEDSDEETLGEDYLTSFAHDRAHY